MFRNGGVHVTTTAGHSGGMLASVLAKYETSPHLLRGSYRGSIISRELVVKCDKLQKDTEEMHSARSDVNVVSQPHQRSESRPRLTKDSAQRLLHVRTGNKEDNSLKERGFGEPQAQQSHFLGHVGGWQPQPEITGMLDYTWTPTQPSPHKQTVATRSPPRPVRLTTPTRTGQPGVKDTGARQMYDKRTLRRRKKSEFLTAIQEWRSKHVVPGGKLRRVNGCQVAVRMRPMFEKEWRQGEYGVVTVVEEWGEVVVHNCLFHADLTRMYTHNSGFCFPKTFGQATTNETVYAECGSPLVEQALLGQFGTLFMFGQTGSGKTYTMNAMLELAVRDIFSAMSQKTVQLKCLEVTGRKCFDLLPRQRIEVRLRDDQNGRTNIVGAHTALVHSLIDCLRVLKEAIGRRATAAHTRNDESSRSHCVCTLELLNSGGSLIFVDCAGTERRQDSDQHSSERMRESAEINSSLHALKECIRYRCKELQRGAMKDHDEDQRQVYVPYRDSQLTRVLHESFTRPNSILTAIGTISPTSMDTEHTLSTLKTLKLLLSDSSNGDAPDFELKMDVDTRSTSKQCFPGRQTSKSGRPRSLSAQPQGTASIAGTGPSHRGNGYAFGGGVTHPGSTGVCSPPLALKENIGMFAVASKSTDRRSSGSLSAPILRTPQFDVNEEVASANVQGGSPGFVHERQTFSASPAAFIRKGALPQTCDSRETAHLTASAADASIGSPLDVVQERLAFSVSFANQTRLHDNVDRGFSEVESSRQTCLSAEIQESTHEENDDAVSSSGVQSQSVLSRSPSEREQKMLLEMTRLHEKAVQLEEDIELAKAAKLAAAAEISELQTRATMAEQHVVDLKTENGMLETLFRSEQMMRRRVLNQLLDLKGHIRVFCRIRPCLSSEQNEEPVALWRDTFTIEVSKVLTSVDGKKRCHVRPFQFDCVFGPVAKQEDVFTEVTDLVQSALDGRNVTIFAYGQTGTGKTHTMYGGVGDQQGVVPRTIEMIFELLNSMDQTRFSSTVRAYLVEMYKIDLIDLFARTKNTGHLEIRKDPRTGDTSIVNVDERLVHSSKQLLKLLKEGMERRSVASTEMNGESSRSHLILSVSLELSDHRAQSVTSGKIRLCDLAGSERPKRSGATNETLREAIEINKALTALGDVIEALCRGSRGLVPYRNHKLTQLLSDSLGGNAKTLMFVNVSAAKSDVEETLNSLGYASRVRNVVNEVRAPCIAVEMGLLRTHSDPTIMSPRSSSSTDDSGHEFT